MSSFLKGLFGAIFSYTLLLGCESKGKVKALRKKTAVTSFTTTAPILSVAAGGDNVINALENILPGVTVSIKGAAGKAYALTCITNCTVTSGATGSLSGDGIATATIQASASGDVVISATQNDQVGNTSLAGTANITADLLAPDFTLLALANGVVDHTLNSADAIANLAVATLSASGYTSANYAIASIQATCDGSVTYKKAAIPTTGDAGFVSGNSYKLCVKLTDNANNTTYGASPGIITVDSSRPSAPTLSIAAGLDSLIDILENTAPGISVSIAGEAGATYTLTCTTNCSVTAGATGTLNLAGTATATIQASASGTIAIFATQSDAAGNTSLAESANTSADLVAPVFTSLALANGAADNTLNAADAAANLAVATISASGHTTATYAIVSTSTTCDGSVTYNKTAIPNTGDAGFITGNSYKLCVKLTDNATNTTYGASSGNIVIDSSTPATPTLSIAAGVDNVINVLENTAPGVNVSITGEAGATYTITCITNCTVTAGATGTLSGGGNATATIQASASGAVAISATQTDTAANTSLAGTANTAADIDAPAFSSLALANGAADNALNAADATANLAVATLSASGHTAADYAIVSTSTTCDGSVTYNKAAIPTAGDAGFVVGNSYKLCVRLADNAANTAYGTSSGNIAVSASEPVISYTGASGTSGLVGSTMNVAPTTLNGNGSSITNCTSSPSLPSGLTINTTTCVISGTPTVATSATTYTITATNSSSSSNATVALTTLYFPPAYALSAQSGADSLVALSWQPSIGMLPVTDYKIYRSLSSGFTPGVGNLVTTTAATTTSYLDSGTTNGTRYYYKVVAVYGSYEAEASVEASALPQNPASATQDLLNIYVAPTGDDTTGNGSIGTPYLTIAKAQTIVTVGGTIILKDGFYTDLPSISKALTLQSMTGDYRTSAVVISSSGSLTPGSEMTMDAPVDNVVFRGIETINVRFSTSNATRSGLGFFNCYFHSITASSWLHANGTANYSNITFYGNYIRSVSNGTRTNLMSFFNYWPDNGHANANWIISYNTLEGTSWGGFQLKGITGLTVTHNTFYGTCDNAIHLWGFFDKTGTVEVAYNLFGSSFQAGGDAACSGSAILLDTATSYGSSHEIKIHDNFFTRNDHAILIDLGTADLTGKPLSIYNNSFETSNTKAIYLKNAAGTLDVRSNYWGHSTGPTYSGNSGGLGSVFDIATGAVTFSPYLTSEPTPPEAVLKGQNELGGSGAPLSSSISSSRVLFQGDLTTNSVNRGAGLGFPSSQGVTRADGLAAFRDVNAGGRMKFFVVDQNQYVPDPATQDNSRILIFNSVPDSPSSIPDVVVGQSNFTTSGKNSASGSTTNQYGFNAPMNVTVCANGMMFVADKLNNRVLGYNSIPTSNGAGADFVIGQPDFSTSSSGTSAATLNSPTAVHCNGNRLFVLEKGNNRIAVYSPIPRTTQPSASYIIGQPDFTTGTGDCTASKLAQPSEILLFDGKIFVADNNNERVLAFPDTGNTNPTAQLVLGQPDFVSCISNRGTGYPGTASAGSMLKPYGLAFDGKNTLAVSDSFNHRVLLFTAPFVNGQDATAQIGQDSLTERTEYSAPNITNRLLYPKRMVFDNGYLWISDSDNSRVVAFPRP